MAGERPCPAIFLGRFVGRVGVLARRPVLELLRIISKGRFEQLYRAKSSRLPSMFGDRASQRHRPLPSEAHPGSAILRKCGVEKAARVPEQEEGQNYLIIIAFRGAKAFNCRSLSLCN